MIDAYLEHCNPGSRSTMRESLRAVARMFVFARSESTAAWDRLTPECVSLLRSALIGRYSPATASRHLAALRSLVKHLGRRGLVGDSDVRAICDAAARAPGMSAMRGRMITPDEMMRMEQAADCPRDRALLAVAAGAGLRRAELSALDCGDIDYAAGKITVRYGKGGKRRTVFLPEAALDALLDLVGRDGRNPLADAWCDLRIPLFTSRGRRRLSPIGVWYVLRGIAERAGVENVTPHDFRRTFASRLLNAGVDLATVQTLMGHSDPVTTSRYDRRGTQRLKDAARALSVMYHDHGTIQPQRDGVR